MRVNKFVALATGMSRRAADTAVAAGRVTVHGATAQSGQDVAATDVVLLDGRALVRPASPTTIMLNKPAGYVVSRAGQGSKTVYDLLPAEYHSLKPVGRLDKDSSGLLLLTNDGQLAQVLTHPSNQKIKIYEVETDKPLAPLHRQMITDYGVLLDDGLSKFPLEQLTDPRHWRVIMHEGRNRQIRRTFASLGYQISRLHRTNFGSYTLRDLRPGSWMLLAASERHNPEE